jgi:NAD(P)-dependent dehydrogenase (short-subunit alcohol dehydrogenase family)
MSRLPAPSPARTIVITGGHTGLGLAASLHVLATSPDTHLVWAVRSPDAARRAAAGLTPPGTADRVSILPLDLAALASVRTFAADLGARLEAGTLPPLGAIVANAGVQFADGLHHTADGVEQTFGVNYLAHFLLVELLRLRLAPDGRIVLVSSGTHFDAPRVWTSAMFGMPGPQYLGVAALARGEVPAGLAPVSVKANQFRYATSKLCTLLFAYELDRRLRAAGSRVTVTAFDPGLMPGTGLARANSAPARWAWNHVMPALRLLPGVNSAETSGRDLARLAVDPSVAGVGGQYFVRQRAVPSSALSRRPELGTELWAGSEQVIATAGVADAPPVGSRHEARASVALAS